MRTAYKVLAYLVAAEVAVQAMVMAWFISGLIKWVLNGGIVDMSIEIEGSFPEIVGILVHGINGFVVIPVLALLLLIVSFFTKVRGAIKWAAIVLVLVAVQVLLGTFGHHFTLSGALHGLNALALFAAALYAGRRLRAATAAAVEQSEARTAAPV
jgi:hypothetical protein